MVLSFRALNDKLLRRSGFRAEEDGMDFVVFVPPLTCSEMAMFWNLGFKLGWDFALRKSMVGVVQSLFTLAVDHTRHTTVKVSSEGQVKEGRICSAILRITELEKRTDRVMIRRRRSPKGQTEEILDPPPSKSSYHMGLTLGLHSFNHSTKTQKRKRNEESTCHENEK